MYISVHKWDINCSACHVNMIDRAEHHTGFRKRFQTSLEVTPNPTAESSIFLLEYCFG